jgi:hypothetical protein
VKIWKVILATLVIFAAGAVAGGILVQNGLLARSLKLSAPTPAPPVPGFLSQQRFQERLKKELQLSEDQTNRIDRIFAESNERMKILWGLIGPEVQKELQEVRESIRAVLTPEQREKFEHLLRQPPHRFEGPRRGSRTNQTNSAGSLSKEKQ